MDDSLNYFWYNVRTGDLRFRQEYAARAHATVRDGLGFTNHSDAASVSTCPMPLVTWDSLWDYVDKRKSSVRKSAHMTPFLKKW